MTVLLNPDVQRLIDEKIKSGQYASPEEAVNALLLQAIHQEELSPDDVDELRAALDPAIAEAEMGHLVQFTAEDVIAQRNAIRKKVS